MPAIVEVGKVYEVSHNRKGDFQMRVQSVSDGWVSGIVTNGRANALLSYNEKHAGQSITVRASFCKFTEATVPA